MNLEEIALNVQKGANGIYYSPSVSKVSYPEEGNSRYLRIEEESFWFKHRNDIIAEGVLAYSPDKVFFDIGGGNGFVAKRLQEEGVKTVLVEPGASGAANALERGVENVFCTTLDDAEFQHGSLDSAGLFDVVEHIENDHAFLKGVHKYLKDDGLLYLTVPAYNGLWSKEDEAAGHYRRYSVSTMNRRLQDCGFQVIRSTYFFSILPIPVLLFRSIPSRLGLKQDYGSLEKHLDEHKPRKSLLNHVLQLIWRWESKRIKRGRNIPFGGSCFCIARKIKST